VRAFFLRLKAYHIISLWATPQEHDTDRFLRPERAAYFQKCKQSKIYLTPTGIPDKRTEARLNAGTASNHKPTDVKHQPNPLPLQTPTKQEKPTMVDFPLFLFFDGLG